MADSTPILGLPYPEATDPADVPADIVALVDALETLLVEGDLTATGAATGDLKYSARSADHGRWLKCDGRELSAAEIVTALSLSSGDADALVALLGTGSSSVYGDAASGKVKLPDLRRVIPIGAGPSGDGSGSLSDRPLKGTGSSGGAETHTLLAAESGLRTHDHPDGTLAAASHSHGDGTLACASHSHSDGTLAVAAHTHGDGTLAAAAHKHDSGTIAIGAGWAGNGAVSNFTGGSNWGILGSAIDNSGTRFKLQVTGHSVSGDTGAETPDVTGATGSASPDVTGATGTAAPDVSGSTGSASADVIGSTGNPTNVASGGSDAANAHNNMPPYRVIGYGYIRV